MHPIWIFRNHVIPISAALRNCGTGEIKVVNIFSILEFNLGEYRSFGCRKGGAASSTIETIVHTGIALLCSKSYTAGRFSAAGLLKAIIIPCDGADYRLRLGCGSLGRSLGRSLGGSLGCGLGFGHLGRGLFGCGLGCGLGGNIAAEGDTFLTGFVFLNIDNIPCLGPLTL